MFAPYSVLGYPIPYNLRHIRTIDMPLLVKHMPACSVSHVNVNERASCGSPSILGYLRGLPLPWTDGPRAGSQHLTMLFYLSYTSDSTKTNDGECPTKATDINRYRELITTSVGPTILLAQQETKHHEPRRPPPGTAFHTLRTRQQQTPTWLGASQPVRRSRRHDFHATPSYIYARPIGSYIARHSESQFEPKAPRRWPEQTWLFVR